MKKSNVLQPWKLTKFAEVLGWGGQGGKERKKRKERKKNMTQRASLASCPAGLAINSPKAENPDKTSSSYAIISP